jgi:hypothetical protein
MYFSVIFQPVLPALISNTPFSIGRLSIGSVSRNTREASPAFPNTFKRGRRSVERPASASPAVANQLNDFIRGGQPARLLLGIDFLLFDENV